MDQHLRKNVLALTALQIGNYVVPLITLPWLTRALGPSGYGRLGFATAVIAYFVLLTEWGFNLSGTRDIAIARELSAVKSSIFWRIFFARLGLGVLCAILLGLLIYGIPRFGDDAMLLMIFFVGVLASAVSPAFYLQGVERVLPMAGINLILKFLSVPLILIFVQDANGIYIAAWIQSMALLMSALINFWMLVRSGEISFVMPNMVEILEQIKASASLFLSTAAVSLYTNSSTVILGLVASDAAVGVFVAAYTVARAALGLMGPVSQALFPRVSYLLSCARDQAEQLLGRLCVLQLGLGLLFSLLLAGISPYMVEWLFGAAFNNSLMPLWCLSALPLLIAASNVLGTQIMVPLGHNSAFSTILVVAGVFNIALAFPLGALLEAVGAALSMVVAEVIVTAMMIYFVSTREPRIWSRLTFSKDV